MGEVDKGCPMIRMGEWVSVSSSILVYTGSPGPTTVKRLCECNVMIFFSCVLHLSHVVICTSFINHAVPISKGVIFACRIINVWNGLPLSMDFSSLNVFKRSIFKTDLSEYLI